MSIFSNERESQKGGLAVRLKCASALVACAGFAALGAEPALAQEAAADDTARLGTVVVTARKTEENLQTTPIAVTALSTEAMESRQIVDVVSIEQNAPNIFIQPSGGGAALAIGIRGQNSSENTAATDAAVGLYVDGVYMARNGAGFMNMLDVAGVEVLRGTQGTLFGRNTTGGALTITTKKPTGELEGELKLNAGNYDQLGISGVVNIPFAGEQVALRVAGSHSEIGDYGRSLTTGAGLGGKDEDFIRAALLIAPEGSNFEAILRADHFEMNGNGAVNKLYSYNPFYPVTAVRDGLAAEFAANQNIDFYDTFAGNLFNGENPSNDRVIEGTSAELTYDFGWGEIKSITGYRTTENKANVEIDGIGPTTNAFQISFNQDNRQDKQISQELQLSGEAGDLNWITGLFYFDEENTDAVLSSTAKTYNDIENGSVGAFAQGTYAFTDKLRMTAGLRYTEDERDITTQTFTSDAFGGICTVAPTAANGVTEGSISVDVANCSYSQNVKYDYVSYLLNFDYQFTDNLFGYVKTSRANRSGGFNNRIAANPFRPEEVTDYEIGLKGEFLGNRLRTNAAFFYTDYKDAQRVNDAIVPATGQVTQLTQNAASAEITGFEIEINALLTDNLEIGGSAGIMDPKYKEYIVPNPRFDPNLPVSATNPETFDRTDEKFDRTSDYSYNIYANYTRPTQFGEWKSTVNYAYKDEVSYGVTQTVPDQALVDGYGILNAKTTLSIEEAGLEFSLWGKNLLEEEYWNYVLSFYDTLGYAGGQVGLPRTYGIEVSKKF